MSIPQLLFYFFAAVVVISALLVLFARNVLYAAFMLIFTFLGIAAIYVLAGADFIAVTQIIVYIGGILVLMIFGLMLTNKKKGAAMRTASHNLFWGVLAGAGMLFILLLLIFSVDFQSLDWIAHESGQEFVPEASSVQSIGQLLMSRYVLPFELAGLLLLMALMGASFIANKPGE